MLDAPPPPGLRSELGPLADRLRELAARFAARVVSRRPDQPHVQEAFEWVGEPAPRTPADYEAARESVSAKIEAHGGVSALSHGSVSAPGISDLDLVISVRGRTGLPDLDDAAWAGMLDESERYVCAHRPFMVPAGMLGRVGEIWPVSGLRGPGAPGGGPDWKSHLFTTVETYALSGALDRYVESFARGRMDARGALLHLRSLRYTLKILRANGAGPDAGGLEAEIEDLSRSWFGLDGGARRARLLCLWADSLAAHLEAVGAIKDRLAQEIRYPDRALGSAHDQAAFVHDWSPRLFLDCAAASAESGRRAHALPSEFLLALCVYGRAGGPFAQYLSAHVHHRVDPAKISCPRAEELFYPRARLLGEAIERLRAVSVPRVVLPTFSDGGEGPGYGGFWHGALSLAASGRPDEALLLCGQYDRMHEACIALAAERDALAARAAECEAEAAQSEAEAAELRRTCDAQSAELRDVRSSLALRLLRRYDATLGKILPLARLARRSAR